MEEKKANQMLDFVMPFLPLPFMIWMHSSPTIIISGLAWMLITGYSSVRRYLQRQGRQKEE